jgi:hypothetical protein
VQSATPPIGFPVPIYPSRQSSANFSAATRGTPSASGTIMTEDPASVASLWYKNYLSNNGWTLKDVPPRPVKSGELRVLSATKGNVQVLITCLRPEKGVHTIINISCLRIPSGDKQ